MHDAGAIAPPLTVSAPDRATSDDDLLRQALAGGAEAREELARRYRGPAYLLALQLLGDRDDAFDVAQESMLRLFARLDRLTPGRPMRPWVLAIVRNQVRDLWRRRRVRRADSIDGAGGDLAAELVDRRPGPEETASHGELRRRVWHAMGRLSADQREIIVLRDFHGLSYAEIAQLLSLKPGTVMSRLHGARGRLRALLTGEDGHA